MQCKPQSCGVRDQCISTSLVTAETFTTHALAALPTGKNVLGGWEHPRKMSEQRREQQVGRQKATEMIVYGVGCALICDVLMWCDAVRCGATR